MLQHLKHSTKIIANFLQSNIYSFLYSSSTKLLHILMRIVFINKLCVRGESLTILQRSAAFSLVRSGKKTNSQSGWCLCILKRLHIRASLIEHSLQLRSSTIRDLNSRAPTWQLVDQLRDSDNVTQSMIKKVELELKASLYNNVYATAGIRIK